MGNISMKEALSGHNLVDLPHPHEVNLQDLVNRVNTVLNLWPKPVRVTSGYRSMQDHLRIYSAKNVPANKIPMGSKHLTGQAIDVSDPDGALKLWLKTDPTAIVAIEKAGLYMEEGTRGWVHFQNVAPRSGHRWFLP